MKTEYEELKKILGNKLRENELLAPHTTFKIGGPADLFFDAKTTDELVSAVKSARKLQIPIYILGGGSNLLIGDKGIRGLVIKNSTSKIVIRGAKGSYKSGEHKSGLVYLEADSGVVMNQLVRFTIEEGLAGLEMQLGLPGSVGGAVYMNSKWTHPAAAVGDAVYQAKILTPDGEVTDVPKSYFSFAYDSSAIQKTGDIVLSVVFALSKESKEKLWQIANDSIAYRRATQPQGVFTLGCTFRNISKAQAMSAATPNQTTSAGFLMDHAGLKGLTVGGAVVSNTHANFIVNQNGATASDVVQLIELCRNAVRERYGVELKEEIVRVGEF